MPSDSETLRKLPFFLDVDQDSLDALAAFAQCRPVKAGQLLARVGDTLQSLIFVLSGQLLVMELAEDGRVIGRGAFGPGHAVGLITLVDGQPSIHAVQAEEDSELLSIPLPAARQFVLSRPLLTERLLKMLAGAIRQNHKEKAMLSLPNAFQRVFMQINLIATQNDDGGPTPLPKQHEIASTVNTSRETVSRALQMLIKSGILTKRGHQIVVQRGEALQRLAIEGPEALKHIPQ